MSGFTNVTQLQDFNPDLTSKAEIRKDNVDRYLAQGKTIIALVRTLGDVTSRRLYDPKDTVRGWYQLTAETNRAEVEAEFPTYQVTFFEVFGALKFGKNSRFAPAELPKMPARQP